MRVHILSPGFDTPNARALLYPFIVWRSEISGQGIDTHLFSSLSSGIADCDALLIDSKYNRHRWKDERSAVLDEFSTLSDRCRVIYCDTTDSSGWLQTDLLDIVHAYAKAQLLRNRTGYTQPMYANRPFADHYHRAAGVTDAHPEWSTPVKDAGLLKKLRVSWNSGLADYSLRGPLRASLYQRVPLAALLRYPDKVAAPANERSRDVSCRFGISYPRASVAHQRVQIRKIMTARLDTRKLSRREYFAELRTSKVVVSPFGFGEITLKDFEVFLTGGLLLKPDMSHMETWPDLFRAGETMVTHDWNLVNFEEALEAAVSDEPRRLAMATLGQDCYLRHTHGPDAAELFTKQLRSVIA